MDIDLRDYNPYMHIIGDVAAALVEHPERADYYDKLIRLMYAWTEAAEIMIQTERAFAATGANYQRMRMKYHRDVETLEAGDPARAFALWELEYYERGDCVKLTERLMRGAERVTSARQSLALIERTLDALLDEDVDMRKLAGRGTHG